MIKYRVNRSGGLNIRSGPGTSYKMVLAASQVPNGTIENSDENVSVQNGWCKLSKPAVGWSNGMYLVKVPEPTKPSGPQGKQLLNENIDEAFAYNPFGDTEEGKYKEEYQKYLKAFGCPPQFNQCVDLQYIDNIAPGVGRTFAQTMLSNPTILSICPGSVDYLPGFSAKDQDTFLNRVTAMSEMNESLKSAIAAEDSTKMNGKLYEFKADYKGFMNITNLLCRAMAIYMKIGDDFYPETKIKLKEFDYAYCTIPGHMPTGKDNKKAIFKETIYQLGKAVSTAVDDTTYIHFFMTHQGTSLSEDIKTDTEDSIIDSMLNGDSTLSSMARQLQFLFGAEVGSDTTDEGVMADISKYVGSQSKGFMSSFANIIKNYMGGGRLIVPKMVGNVSYSKSFSCCLKFTSPYGDPRSIFLRCMVPTMHLLALALPKQIAQNMYTYPFIVRVFEQGFFNSDLAIISNLNIKRGGQDDTSWTVDALSTEVEVTFDVEPLYSSLMVSSANHPFKYMQNTALTEYLATIAGVDLKANNIEAKINNVVTMLTGSFKDIPASQARGVADWMQKNISKIFMIGS